MIDDLIQGFDSGLFCELVSSKFSGTFSAVSRSIPVDADLPWKGAEQLGVVKSLPGPNGINMPLLVVSAELPEGEELRERSSRIKQFKFAKKVLDSAMSNPSPGVDGLLSQGLFVFHDDQGNFRLSLVYGKPEGTKLVWSVVKRLSFYVEAGAGNKTFRDRADLPWSTFDKLQDAFSVEKLTKEFYSRLFKWYQWALSDEMGVTYPNDTETHEDDRQISEHIIRLITRLMFVWFLKQKHLVPDDLFDQAKLKQNLKRFDPDSGDNYYRAILQNLFFATLNSQISERAFATQTGNRSEHFDIKTLYRYPKDFAISEAEVLELFKGIPFLNGGLFECLDRGRNYYDGFSRNRNKAAKVPNRLFFDETDGLVPLLNQYNFTVEENSPGDEEVALDPELLGKAFENLLAAYNPETNVQARKATGSFYTPREIVNYMVDESLIAHLKARCGEEHEESIRKLFDDGERPADEALCEELDQALVTAKILDPACGSGAFPMGVLLRMVENLRVLRGIPEDDSVYDLKLQLIENCIYGADIQCIAVQISKLRFFISLVCEQKKDDSAENYGINSLPNLETKFVAANSLIGLPQSGRDVLDLCTGDIATLKKQLFEVRHQHFSAKTFQEKKGLRHEDKKLRDSIRRTVRHDAQPDRERLELLLKEREKVAEPKWKQFANPPAKQEEMFADLAKVETEPTELSYDANEKPRKALDADIARERRKEGIPNTLIDFIAGMLASWDPYDQNTRAPYLDPEWMFNVGDGFDITIGNPPYVRADEQSEWNQVQRKAIIDSKQYETLWEKWDLYVAFIERAFKLLAPGGVSSMIVSDAFCHSKYAQKPQKWFLKNARVLRLDFCSDLKIFEAAVHNLVYFFQKANGDQSKPERRVHVRTFGQVSVLQTEAQSMLTHRAFFPEDREAFTCDAKTVQLDSICYITKGMVVHANERLARGAFTLGDLVRLKRDAEHPKRFVEGKNLDRWIPLTTNWIEWGTERAPSLFSRPTFPEIYTAREKLISVDMAAGVERLRVTYDDQRLHHNHSAWSFVPWHYLAGVRNRSIKKTTRYVNETPLRPDLPKREYLESTSQRFSTKYLAGVMNSTVAYAFLMANRRSNIHLYPDDWKKLPIPDVSKGQQKPVADTVDRILAARKKGSTDSISEMETKLDELVFSLYKLTSEQIEDAKAAADSVRKKHAPAKDKKVTPVKAKKKTRRRRRVKLPPSLPGWD
jgi:adenine-specific DNA-methyltransferase